jgi:hypothetical protein
MTSRRRTRTDVVAGSDQPPSGARYELRRRYVVPVAAIELDEHVLAWVRRYFPGGAAEPIEGYQGTIYPVFERGDRLVLVAGFATFAAQREGGSEWVTVLVLDAANEREFLELAGALAMSSGP